MIKKLFNLFGYTLIRQVKVIDYGGNLYHLPLSTKQGSVFDQMGKEFRTEIKNEEELILLVRSINLGAGSPKPLSKKRWL